MRLQAYITESMPDYRDIEYDCAPFFDAIKGSKKLVYRGSQTIFPYEVEIIKRRTNRKPHDTPLYIHKMLDKAFLRRFGWKARSSGVFTSGDEDQAMHYGDACIFVPIGQFEFVWSPEISDLYTEIDDIAGPTFDSMDNEEIDDLVETYRNTNLKMAIKSGNEIMFDCDRYYMANMRLENKILDMIK